MSRQLTVSATISAMVMALFAVASLPGGGALGEPPAIPPALTSYAGY